MLVKSALFCGTGKVHISLLTHQSLIIVFIQNIVFLLTDLHLETTLQTWPSDNILESLTMTRSIIKETLVVSRLYCQEMEHAKKTSKPKQYSTLIDTTKLCDNKKLIKKSSP